jgi:hypothetical protein
MTRLLIILGWFLLWSGTPSAFADEKDDKAALEAQKKAALENWEKVGAGEAVTHDTAHFLILARKASGGKLKPTGELLEKTFELAGKTLFTPKESAWKGRLTVYLLGDTDQVAAFIRRIEKRRPLRQETASFMAKDDQLHVVVAPGEKSAPPEDVQAAQQVASVMITRRAGLATVLPDWLVNGFGRATWYRLVGSGNRVVIYERQWAMRYVRLNKRNIQDVWNGGLEGDEPVYLRPSLADFFAYGPGRAKFVKILEGFKPGENQDRRSMEQALESAGLKVDMLNKAFHAWVARPN